MEEAEEVRDWGVAVETEVEEVEEVKEVEVEGVEEVWAARRSSVPRVAPRTFSQRSFDVIQSSHISKFAGPVRTGQVTVSLEDDSGIT